MEFDFNINDVFKDEICEIDHELSVNGKKTRFDKDLRKKLSDMIDLIGQNSAKAQELPKAVTTTEKLRSSSDHIIYIAKDPNGNQGKGTIVGILKIGSKKLFLLDSSGQQNELMPLCILDFYVHESQQRKGHGKQLFDFMLQAQKTEAHLLAIDRPSLKFLAFLKKHYNLHETIPQVNNFTVFKEFFLCRPIGSKKKLLDLMAKNRLSDPTGFSSYCPGGWDNLQLDTDKSLVSERNSNRKNYNRISYPGTSQLRHEMKFCETSKAIPVQNNAKTIDLETKLGSHSLHGASDIKTTDNFSLPMKNNRGRPADIVRSPRDHVSVKDDTQTLAGLRTSPLSEGKPRQYDSSMNIFGVPASWNQASCSVRSGQ